MRPFLFIPILAFATPAFAAGVAWDDLPERMAQAPAVRALDAEASAALARLGTASRDFAPRLEAWAGGRAEAWRPEERQTSGSGPEAGLRGGVNLWRGGRDAARRRQRQAEAGTAHALARAEAQDLLLQTRLAWLDAWQARARMAALAQAQARGLEDLQRVRRQSSAGLVPRSDVLALEMLNAELDQHVFDASHLADEAEHHVAAMLGLEAEQADGLAQDQALDWPASPQPRSHGTQRQEAAAAALAALQSEAQSLGGDWQPGLDLEGQYRQGRPGQSLSEASDWQALAALSLAWDPSGAQGLERARVRSQTEAQRLRLEAQFKADKVRLAELDHALASWLGRRQAVEARLEAAMGYRKAVLEESARGVRDSRDLAESNEAWLEAEQDRITAQVRAWTVWSEREAYTDAKP